MSTPTRSIARAKIPQKNIDDLFVMGAFGVKTLPQYGGLGLSQGELRPRRHVVTRSWDANLTALFRPT